MLGILARLIPQSSEQVVDNDISVESKMAFSALFGVGFVYLSKISIVATLVDTFGFTQASAAAIGVGVGASVAAWLIAFLHKHVYNGNAAPVVMKQVTQAAATQQLASAPIQNVVVADTAPAAATVSAPVPNAPAPAAVATPPAPPSPTTQPTSSASSQG